MTATATRSSSVTATGEALRRSLDGPFHNVKQRWRDEVTASDFVRDPDWDIPTAREWALDKLLALAARDFAIAGFPEAQGGRGTVAESVAHFEMLAMGDCAMTIQSGVQHGLRGGAATTLGTQ